MGPPGGPPPLDRRLVPLAGPALRFLAAPALPAQDLPDVGGVVRDPEGASDDRGPPRQGPEVGAEPVGLRPVEEELQELRPLPRGQAGGPPRGGLARRASGPPAATSACQRLTADRHPRSGAIRSDCDAGRPSGQDGGITGQCGRFVSRSGKLSGDAGSPLRTEVQEPWGEAGDPGDGASGSDASGGDLPGRRRGGVVGDGARTYPQSARGGRHVGKVT